MSRRVRSFSSSNLLSHKINMVHIVLSSQVLEGLSLGLWNEKAGEDTEEHESGVDLHDVVEPRAGVLVTGLESTSPERCNGGLGDDRTNLSGSGRDTVGGRTVTGWETFTGNNECGSVGSEVKEKLNDNVDSEHAVAGHVLEIETPDNEKDSEDTETTDLNGFSANGIDGSNGDPITRDRTGTNEDTVTGSEIVQLVVNGWSTGVSDSGQNGRVVQTKTVESDIKQEP